MKHPLAVGTKLKFLSGVKAEIETANLRCGQWVYTLKGSTGEWTKSLFNAAGVRVDENQMPGLPADHRSDG
jgi:hypothetical protein